MSAKIQAVALDGKYKTLTRVRAQRLVDTGTHVWIGERTVREIRPAKKAFALADRVSIFPADYFYPYPQHQAHPELHDLPFNYPLPYELLKSYEAHRTREIAV